MENVNGRNTKPPSHLPASSSSDSSLELSAHPKDPLGDLYTKSEHDASSTPAQQQQHQQQWSMMSNSPRADTGFPLFPSESAFPPNLEMNNTSQMMKSPPTSTTNNDHPPGYDPNRIPASIFSSKPTTAEWSTASNESLFSIQMGTNSFSTDYSYLLTKSGELNNKPEEWKNESKNLSSPLPPRAEVKGDNDGKNCTTKEKNSVVTPKIGSEEKPSNNMEKKTTRVVDEPFATTTSNMSEEKSWNNGYSPAHSSSPCHSEASGNSGTSFAFPVLVNDGAKSNSLKGATEEVAKPQPKPELQPEKQPVQQQQEEQQKSEPQPKKAEKSWCACLSCWPRCC